MGGINDFFSSMSGADSGGYSGGSSLPDLSNWGGYSGGNDYQSPNTSFMLNPLLGDTSQYWNASSIAGPGSSAIAQSFSPQAAQLMSMPESAPNSQSSGGFFSGLGDKISGAVSDAWDKDPMKVLGAGVSGLGGLAEMYSRMKTNKALAAMNAKRQAQEDAVNAIRMKNMQVNSQYANSYDVPGTAHVTQQSGLVGGPMTADDYAHYGERVGGKQAQTTTTVDPNQRVYLAGGGSVDDLVGGDVLKYVMDELSDKANGGMVGGFASGGPVDIHALMANHHAKIQQALAARGMAPDSGQADSVPAMLSHGEYVVPADVVSALGDGNTKAGAGALDQMRHNVRKHVRSAPANKLPPKAKKPVAYMKGKT